MRRVCALGALVAAAVGGAFGQSNLGSIQGTVVGSDGTPLAGVRVLAAVKAASQKTKAPPTLVSSVQGGATSQSGGKTPGATFLISKLPAGMYVLCAETTMPGWLDPCHWSATVPVVNVAAAQNVTGQVVVMAKGAVIQVRLNDPGKILSANPGAMPRDVAIIVRGSNGGFYNARVSSIDSTGQYRQVTLPFDTPHTLTVRSDQLALLDAGGAAVPSSGHAQPVQVASSAAGAAFTFTVAGRAH